MTREQAIEELEKMDRQIIHGTRFFAEVAKMLSDRVLTCVYCGHEYPQDTPASGAQVLTDHIKVCEKHPMRKVESDKAKLQKALGDLLGIGSPEELDGMEAALRATPGIEHDKIVAINAIHVLQDTLD